MRNKPAVDWHLLTGLDSKDNIKMKKQHFSMKSVSFSRIRIQPSASENLKINLLTPKIFGTSSNSLFN